MERKQDLVIDWGIRQRARKEWTEEMMEERQRERWKGKEISWRKKQILKTGRTKMKRNVVHVERSVLHAGHFCLGRVERPNPKVNVEGGMGGVRGAERGGWGFMTLSIDPNLHNFPGSPRLPPLPLHLQLLSTCRSTLGQKSIRQRCSSKHRKKLN